MEDLRAARCMECAPPNALSGVYACSEIQGELRKSRVDRSVQEGASVSRAAGLIYTSLRLGSSWFNVEIGQLSFSSPRPGAPIALDSRRKANVSLVEGQSFRLLRFDITLAASQLLHRCELRKFLLKTLIITCNLRNCFLRNR